MNLVGIGSLSSVSYQVCKTNGNPRKIIFVGNSGPSATFNLFFLWFGWLWVGEFVGFMIIFTCFPTQQNLVYRKHYYEFYLYQVYTYRYVCWPCCPATENSDLEKVWSRKRPNSRLEVHRSEWCLLVVRHLARLS